METAFYVPPCQCTIVLIVPCGMETAFKTAGLIEEEVLIVPCGMETTQMKSSGALYSEY